ncbi:MAG: lipopolysaccharide biosynthesis protein [Hyphomicrobiaceae bacterium]
MAAKSHSIGTAEVGHLGAARDLFWKIWEGLAARDERGGTQRAALVAFAIRVASAGIAYLSQVLMARWMGAFDYGVFVYVWVWVLILGGLSTAGLSVSVIRFVPEYKERGEPALWRGVVRQSRVLAVSISTCVALLGLAGIWLLGDLVESHFVLPAYLALFCLPIYTLTDVQDGIGRAHSWIQLALLPPYVLRPLFILLGMVAAHAAGLPMEAPTAAGAAIVATWAAGLIQLSVMEPRLTAETGHGPRATETGRWLRTSLPILFIYGFELLLQNTDVLVLSRFVAPSEIGVYFAALKTISLISFVHYAVGSAVASRLSALNTRGDRAGLAAFVSDAANWTFWPSLAGATALLIAGPSLLGFFGADFQSGYPVMFALAAGFLVRAAFGPAEFVLRMLGEERACAYVLGGTALFNIALNVLLVSHYGMMGSAIATATSLSLAAVVFAIVAWARLGLDISVFGAVKRRAADA